MPGEVRLNQKELEGLIEQIEAEEGDATELKKLRAEFSETQQRQPARPGGLELRVELSAEERLNLEAGDLFPGGITTDIMDMLIDYDRKHSLADLKTMCVEAGLSPSGHKKLLAAKLIAHQWEGEAAQAKGRAASTIYLLVYSSGILLRGRGSNPTPFLCLPGKNIITTPKKRLDFDLRGSPRP